MPAHLLNRKIFLPECNMSYTTTEDANVTALFDTSTPAFNLLKWLLGDDSRCTLTNIISSPQRKWRLIVNSLNGDSEWIFFTIFCCNVDWKDFKKTEIEAVVGPLKSEKYYDCIILLSLSSRAAGEEKKINFDSDMHGWRWWAYKREMKQWNMRPSQCHKQILE